MSFYNEFPHTRNYDDDLRQLICMYKKLLGDYDTLVKIYEIVKQDISDITIDQLQKWLDDGTLENIVKSSTFVLTVFDNTEILKAQNLAVNQIVKTLNNHEQDGYGSLYLIKSEADITTFNVLLNNGLYANMIISHKFNINQIDETDLDLVLPKIMKSDMSIELTNKEMTITYDINEWADLKNIYINFTNSIITAKAPYSKTHANIMRFNRCENIKLKGGEFNGQCGLNSVTGESTEWCQCFNILATNNYEISDMVIHDFCGDAIEVGNVQGEKYIDMSGKISFLEIYNVHRNGISVLDCDNIVISDCNIHDISQLASNPRSMPLCSVDCEPYFNLQSMNNVIIKDIKAETPGGIAVFSSKKSKYLIENCYDQAVSVRHLADHITNDLIVDVINCRTLNTSYIQTNGIINYEISKPFTAYKALHVNLGQDNDNDLFLNGHIILVGTQSTQSQEFYLENGTYLSENSKIDITMNVGFASAIGLNQKSIIHSDAIRQISYGTLFDSFDSNFKKVIFTGSAVTFNGKDFLYQRAYFITTQQCTLTTNNNAVTYLGYTSGTLEANTVLELIPYTYNNNKYVIIKKL